MKTYEKTRDRAKGRWRDILTRLGVDPKFLQDKHGPCPVCGGKDRYRFDDKNQDGDFYCSQCGPGTGMKLLMAIHGWDFPKTAKEVDAIVGMCGTAKPKPERSPESKREYMIRLFTESTPVKMGDPVWRYLTNRCGDVSGLLSDIRFHPNLKHAMGTRHPAMLAFMGWDGKIFHGIHRTYLTPDGRKADVDPVRASYGEVGPIRLGSMAPVMGIAEGIETALCASRIFGMPVWSSVSANGMETWEPPSECTNILICGDNDLSFTGQAAAFVLAKRMVRKGLHVEVVIPETVGADWADFYLKSAA